MGNLQVGTNIQLKTTYGTPNNLVYFAWSPAGPGAGSTNQNLLGPKIDWDMNNPFGFPDFLSQHTNTQPGVTIGSDGSVSSSAVTVPTQLSGFNIWFQASQWSIVPNVQVDMTDVLDAGVVQ